MIKKNIVKEQLSKNFPMIAQFTTNDEEKMDAIERYANYNNGMRMIYNRKSDGNYVIQIYKTGKLNPEAHKKVKELILKEIPNKSYNNKNYRIGSILVYKTLGDNEIKRIKVTNKLKNIKNGRPGFIGTLLIYSNVESDSTGFGYNSQIIKVEKF